MARTEATITMSMREADRLKVMQAVVDPMLPVDTAAKRIGVTPRQLERLLIRYKEESPAGLTSRKRGNPVLVLHAAANAWCLVIPVGPFHPRIDSQAPPWIAAPWLAPPGPWCLRALRQAHLMPSNHRTLSKPSPQAMASSCAGSGANRSTPTAQGM